MSNIYSLIMTGCAKYEHNDFGPAETSFKIFDWCLSGLNLPLNFNNIANRGSLKGSTITPSFMSDLILGDVDDNFETIQTEMRPDYSAPPNAGSNSGGFSYPTAGGQENIKINEQRTKEFYKKIDSSKLSKAGVSFGLGVKIQQENDRF